MKTGSAVLHGAVLLLLLAAASTTAAVNSEGELPAVFDVDAGHLAQFLGAHPLAIVTFHKPGCGACEAFMPVYREGAARYRNTTSQAPPPSAVEPGNVSDTVDARREAPVVFVAVDMAATESETLEQVLKRYELVKFPSTRAVVHGKHSAPVNFGDDERANDPEAVVEIGRAVGRRFHFELNKLSTYSELADLINARLVKDAKAAVAGRTLILAQFDPNDGKPVVTAANPSPGANSAASISACRTAFGAAMVALLEVNFIDVFVSFDADMINHAKSFVDLRYDITLPGHRRHPDEHAECSFQSTMAILKCADIDDVTGDCIIGGAVLPIATTADQVVRALATHAMPLLTLYDTPNKILLDRVALDRSMPIPNHRASIDGLMGANRGDPAVASTASFDALRSDRRTRPMLIYFTQVKNCGAGSPEARALRYKMRTLRELAMDHPNITFVVADDYEYNTLYLRLGFKRRDAINDIVFGIIDGGRRYSALPMNNTEGYAASKVREFIQAFNSGTITRYWKSSKLSGFTGILPPNEPAVFNRGHRADGLRVVSSRDLERALFRLDAEPSEADRRAFGAMDDLVLVLFAHQHCKHCLDLVRRFHRMAEVQRELIGILDDRHGVDPAVSVPSMFLESDPSSVGSTEDVHLAASEFDFTDLNDDPSNRFTATGRSPISTMSDSAAAREFKYRVLDKTQSGNRLSGEANTLRRLRFFVVNASGNDAPTEHWMPSPQLNLFPVIGGSFRSSRVAYDNGAATWDVTARSPGLLDLNTERFGESGPRELDILAFAADELREGSTLGQKFLRS